LGELSLRAGEENDNACLSWTLDNESDLYVNMVTTENGGAFHHSNWFFVPDTLWKLPDGEVWPCRENGFDELAATVQGGVLYAQSTQTRAEEQRFAPGAAIRVPKYARVIAWNHFLNAGDRAVDTQVDVTLHTLPPKEVTVRLTPFRMNYADIHLPPLRSSDLRGDCAIQPEHERLGEPWEFRLHYILPHYHQLGTHFELAATGPAMAAMPLYSIENTFGEPLGHTFDPPVDLPSLGASGLRFRCGYQNTHDREIVFGIGEEEMCVALGFAESPVRFDAQFRESTTSQDNPVGSATLFGPCGVIGYRWE